MIVDGVTEKLDRIEAMLRERGWHEPSCPVRVTEKANASSPGMYFYATGACDCWLSEPGGTA